MTGEERVEHNFRAAPLRNIWLSLIPKSERERLYDGASAEFPSNLVSTSIFCLDFWETLSKNQRSIKTTGGRVELLPERAWFGIRSLLKGGNLGYEKTEFDPSDFAQLVKGNKDKKQIPRRWTSNHFSNEELELILSIHSLYEKWKTSKEMYDDLDIVRTALKHWDGINAKNIDKILPDIKERALRLNMTLDDIIRKGMSFGNERFQFKTAFRKRYAGATDEHKNRVLKWLKKWETKEHKSTRIGISKNGYNVWKQRLSHKGSEGGGRIFFTPLKDPGLNNGKVHLQIYDFTFSHDYQDKIIQETLNLEPDLESENWNEVNLNIQKGSTLDTPGTGPSKPLPGPITDGALEHLDDSSNISLDIYQKRAIAESQPLLIDGLAGTGKTAVLSKRGAFRAGYEQNTGLEILISSSKAHVSKRLIHDIESTIENTEWKDIKRKRKFNYTINGFGKKKGSSCNEINLTKFSDEFPETGFDEIILDECQDLTALEFKLLCRLCIGNDPRRLTIAGDPLQTLNPTGFDWGRITAMFIDAEVKRDYVATTEFHRNYRSQEHIVKFANAIQNHRNKLFPKEKHTVMEPDRDAGELPKLLAIDNSDKGKEALTNIIENAEANKIAIICWASDDAAVKRLLEGEDSDDLLSEIWEKVENKEDDEHFRTKIGIHSSSSIKGAEYKNVLLYKFASNPNARKSLESLLTEIEQLKSGKIDEKITISYAYSRLYVAITRSLDKIYFIEDKDGFEFWENMRITDDEAKSNQKFLSPWNAEKTTKLFKNIGEQKDARYDTFKDNKFDWETQGDIIALQTAIRMGRELMKRGDTRVKHSDMCILRAELSLRESKETTDTTIRQKKLEKAVTLFEEAGEINRVAPIKFEMEDWGGCLTSVSKSKDQFLTIVGYYCRMKLGDLKSDFTGEKSSIERIVKNVKIGLPENNPKYWTNVDLQRAYEELKDRVFQYLKEQKQYEILYENVNFFRVIKVYKALPLSEHVKLVKLFEDKKHAYEFNNNLTEQITNKYVESLVMSMKNETDYEKRIEILENKEIRPGLNNAIKSRISEEIAKTRIELLKNSKKIKSPAKNVFDGKRKCRRGLTKPTEIDTIVGSQLNAFHHLCEIKSKIGEVKFVGYFGHRLNSLSDGIQDIDAGEIGSAMKHIYQSRVIHKNASGSIQCDGLNWIDDDEILDRLVKSLFEKIQKLEDPELYFAFFDYAQVIEKSVYPLYEQIIQTLINDLPSDWSQSKTNDMQALKQIFTHLCDHICSKGKNAKKSELSYISKFIKNIACYDTANNIDSESVSQLKQSKLRLDIEIDKLLDVMVFEIENPGLIRDINSGAIEQESRSKAEQYIELLKKSDFDYYLSKSEEFNDLIPIGADELLSDLRQCNTLEQFYSKLNKVIENDKETAKQIIQLKLFTEVFDNIEAELEDLSSNLGHASWEFLCKNKDGSNFDMLFELCIQTKNPVNVITVCKPKWSLLSLTKKYDVTIKQLEESFAGVFVETKIRSWSAKNMDKIQSKITTGKAKGQKSLGEKDKLTLTQLNDVQGSIWGNELIDNIVTYLVICLYDCDLKQLENILSEIDLPKSGIKIAKIKRLINYCGYEWKEMFDKIVSLK
ncbi:MAG: hypothetical protein DWC06_04235 [Candidatus Poseidoniales archaeon]|nr:MAG: hypothetical protein DWC06_04235 [Candidatus Poseidoniales archaeon]